MKPTGFREYDARWLFPQEINLMGMQTIGMALATLMRERGVPARIVTGHDYRAYSSSIKCALMSGMLAGGAEVHDIGLALSPMAYFAQFALDVEGVAMVTASHNDNGWTGIKMGMGRPLTFGPDEMTALKAMVLEGRYETQPGGSYYFHADMAQRYMDDLAAARRSSARSRPWWLAATARLARSRRRCWRGSALRLCRSTPISIIISRTTIRTRKT